MVRSERLSSDLLVTAALALVEDEGVEAVTMRRLAAELDTAPASLYRHVASREELLRLVGDRVLAEIRLKDASESSWQARTATWARQLRGALGRSRGRVALLMGPVTPAPESYPHFQAVVASYVEAGFPAEVAEATAQAVVFIVLSFADLESQWPDALRVPSGSLLLPPDGEASTVGSGNDEMFEFLLAAVIAQSERRLALEP